MARYQYSTSPKKVEPDFYSNKRKIKEKEEAKERIKKEAKERAKQKKADLIRKRKVITVVMLAFGMLLAISYRNSLINEDFNKVKSLKSELSALEKENQQIEVAIESSLNYTKIEQEAKSKLGMQKLDNNQKIYVNLPKKDYVAPASDGIDVAKNQNWFQQFLSKIKIK